MEKIKEKVRASAQEQVHTNGEPKVQKEQRRQNVQHLLLSCINVFREPEHPEFASSARQRMLQMAKMNATIAHIIRNGGFKTISKFPADFDTLEACKQCYLHLSPFIENAQSALKKGNAQNIAEGSDEAWKSVFETEMSKHMQVPWYQEIVSESDVMDGIVIVGRLRAEATKLAADAAKKKAITVQTGRAVNADARQQLSTLKRKLSDMSLQGDSLAEEALKKISSAEDLDQENQEKERSEEAPVQGEGAGRGRGRKRGVRAKRKAKRAGPKKQGYSRKKGDELRLIKKREIATRYLFAVLYLYLGCLCHLLVPFSAKSGFVYSTLLTKLEWAL